MLMPALDLQSVQGCQMHEAAHCKHLSEAPKLCIPGHQHCLVLQAATAVQTLERQVTAVHLKLVSGLLLDATFWLETDLGMKGCCERTVCWGFLGPDLGKDPATLGNTVCCHQLQGRADAAAACCAPTHKSKCENFAAMSIATTTQ